MKLHQKVARSIVMASFLVSCVGHQDQEHISTKSPVVNKVQFSLFYKSEKAVVEKISYLGHINNGLYHINNYKSVWSSNWYDSYLPDVPDAGSVHTIALAISDDGTFINPVYYDVQWDETFKPYASFRTFLDNRTIQFENIKKNSWDFGGIVSCENTNKLMYYKHNAANLVQLYQYDFFTNHTEPTALMFTADSDGIGIDYCNNSDYVSVISNRYPADTGVYNFKTGEKVFSKRAKFDNKFSKYIITTETGNIYTTNNYYDIPSNVNYPFNPQYNFHPTYIRDNGLMLGKNQFGYTLYDIYNNKQYLLTDILKYLDVTDINLDWKEFQFDISNNGKYLIITGDCNKKYNYILITFNNDIKNFLIDNIKPI